MPERDAVKNRLAQIAERVGRLEAQLGEINHEVVESMEMLSKEPAPTEPAAAPVAESEPQGSLELQHVNDLLRKLSVGGDQEQILEIFLEEALSYVDRAILFLERDGRYVTWKGFGFDAESIRDVELSGESEAVVRAAEQRRLIYRRDDLDSAFSWLVEAGEMPSSTLCIPFVFDESAPIVFYGDSKSSVPIDSVELLVHLTVLALKNDYLLAQYNAQKQAAAVTEAPVAPAEEPAESVEPETLEGESAVAEEEPLQELQFVDEPSQEAESDGEHQADDESATGLEMTPETETATEDAPHSLDAVEQDSQALEVEEPPADQDSEAFSFEAAAEEEEVHFNIEIDADSEAAPEGLTAEEHAPSSEPVVEETVYPDSAYESTAEESVAATPEAEPADSPSGTEQEASAHQPEEEPEVTFESAPESEQVEIVEPSEFESVVEPGQGFEAETSPNDESRQEVQEASPQAPEWDAAVELSEDTSFSAGPDQPAPVEAADFSPETAQEADAFDPVAATPAEEAEETFEAVQHEEREPEAVAEAAPDQAPAPPTPLSEESGKAHDEAKRFARLLVSEIKLYNEEEVEQGRQNSNLYLRLQRDVDRSRDMYEKRVDPDVSATFDYFHEELVRILAEGDGSRMGSDYPGARA